MKLVMSNEPNAVLCIETDKLWFTMMNGNTTIIQYKKSDYELECKTTLSSNVKVHIDVHDVIKENVFLR